LAETQAANADPVAGLIDIPLPREVNLWPQTWESRIAVVVLLIVVVAAAWRLVHFWRVNRYRREALAELNSIGHASPSIPRELLPRITLLVRRTALAAFPRERIASLAGPAWLSFLDRSYGGHEFSQGVGRLLVSASYQQILPDEAELQSLSGLVRRWIKVHHA
jgi:hypothetical protein